MAKRVRKRIAQARKKARKTVRCRKCGKEFMQVLAGVWYCSGECERLAHNPVAKFLNFFKSGSGVHKSKKTYTRKEKHRVKLH